MNTCRVRGCRYKLFHVTQGHKCRNCGLFGHGLQDCGNQNEIENLKEISKYDRLPNGKFCDLQYCQHFWSHTRESHVCSLCNERGHSYVNCINQNNNLIQTDQNIDYEINLTYYNIQPAANAAFDNNLINDWVNNWEINPISNNFNITCPMCRKKNTFPKDQKKVFGIEDKCKICLTNNVEIYLPVCGHTVMCMECAKYISN